MKIGELGRQAGVSPKTIRYYEDIGLLPAPERTENGYRSYGGETVERLSFIRDAQAGGLSLAEIGSILDQRDRGESTCEHVRELLDQHVGEIDDQIRRLESMRSTLAAIARRAATLDPADCVDPHRCQTILPGAGRAQASRATGATVHRSPAS